MVKETSDIIPSNQSLFSWSTSKCKKIADNNYLKLLLFHSESHFSEFTFDILAMLKGNYHPNILSSMYGIGSNQWEAGSAMDIRYSNPEDVKRFNEENKNFINDSK